MSGTDFVVPPRSWEQIEQLAVRLREEVVRLGLKEEPCFPVIDVIEKLMDNQLGMLEFRVGSVEEMGLAEGYTCPNGTFIELREDVYEGACKGDGRARFTAAHELGHFFLHTKIPLARVGDAVDVKPFRRAEPQANQFAAGLLMPASYFSRGDTSLIVVARHGVSFAAAENRLSYFRSKGTI